MSAAAVSPIVVKLALCYQKRMPGDLLIPVNGGGGSKASKFGIYMISFIMSAVTHTTTVNDEWDCTLPAIEERADRYYQWYLGCQERTNTAIHLGCTFAYILLLYLFLWNLQEVENNGWASIPALMAACWALLGIEAAAVEFERPYQLHPNHFSYHWENVCCSGARNFVQTI